MPHAVRDENMVDIDELGAISRFVGGYGEGGEASEFASRDFDQTHKADDAIDYEDISDDDDLPEEEAATNGVDDDAEMGNAPDTMFSGADGSSGLDANGDSYATHEQSGDLFGDVDETNDLFGDGLSSPEADRRSHSIVPAQRPGGGLALPSKSSLALPTASSVQIQPSQTQGRPTSASPTPSLEPYSVLSPQSMTSDDSDEDVDINVALQRRLFREAKRRAAGEDVLPAAVETDMDLFYTLYPGYEEYAAPRFVELFPPRNGSYKGKVPLKPPKPVVPTKLSLDLLPDQERSFKTGGLGPKPSRDSTYLASFVDLKQGKSADDSEDSEADSTFDPHERIGAVTMEDLAMICEDWDVPSLDTASLPDEGPNGVLTNGDGDYDQEEQSRPSKKRRIECSGSGLANTLSDNGFAGFEDPERTVAKLAKVVALDLNDPHLLMDEHAPRLKRRTQRIAGDSKRDKALNRDLTKRYNISNDQAYDLLKENHQHKIRSTLGSMAVEHSLPAARLQYPFYRVSLDPKAKRAFHRPHLDLKNQIGREYRFQKPRYVKKKNWRGREAKEVYAKAEDLSFGDNASTLLLEYSEEAPMMMSNFGMGNRLINYYRKKDADDQERPKREIGETQVLLTQDKSPFANFGHVDGGEVVPTVQNGMYRAPVFQHEAKPADFLIGISSTYETGDRLFLRNVENLHVVGQQFPIKEVPGQHSRKVTDASKKRLKTLAYRIYNKSLTRKDKVLNNATLMPHLPGHDMPQTRSKMREFMKYDRNTTKSEAAGVWVPKPGEAVPDEETMRAWIRPEDICLLDSMQVGVQHLADLGISESKEADEDKDVEDSTGAGLEQQLAPWRATKNFINATQGKAMLSLYGEGDPTGCGLGFSFVKTSMKGGFVAQGESIADKLDKRRLKENGGHSYNVAKQQDAYDKAIRGIWDAQKDSLESKMEASDHDIEDDPEHMLANGRATTPRSSIAGTPAPLGRLDDDYSQFSGHSATRGNQIMIINRSGGRNEYGEETKTSEIVTNPRVIALYKKRVLEGRTASQSLEQLVPTGDAELDAHNRQKLEQELLRIKRNAERREAREKAKAKLNTNDIASAAGSPRPSDADGPASTLNGSTPQKAKNRNKDGTQRKCANCGQVGHIKTNRKLCPLLNGTMKPEDAGANGDSSFGAVPAPLTL